MSVNKIIEDSLKSIVPNIWPLVCVKRTNEYIVYNPEIDVPDNFGDNQAGTWVLHMQVHLFTKADYTIKRKKIRKALLNAGFAIDEIITTYEEDTGYYHLCFSCSIEENMEE